MLSPVVRRLMILGCLLVAPVCFAQVKSTKTAAKQWYKGNLHTHSFWSDGDNFPELIAEWYKTNGYHFLSFSDHNSIQEGEKWAAISPTNQAKMLALEKYTKRFGTNYFQERVEGDIHHVRLKTFQEYRSLFDEPGKFLLMPGEEVSDRYLTAPIHMGAINIKEFVQPRGGNSVVEVMENNIGAVLEQRKRTGQPMFSHINHPNFQWAITAEELMQVRKEKFFEIYNGHPHVHVDGDATHASNDRIWDIMLTRRLAELKLGVVYGVGTDDSHNYHFWKRAQSNPGRGWVMVRASALSPTKIIEAMEAGDFYASSGVQLKNVKRGKKAYSVEVDAEPGVDYAIQFIGTRRGYSTNSEPIRAASGTPLRVTHRYSSDIGTVLQEVHGTSATYNVKGDEIYIRAKIISSRAKTDSPSGIGRNAGEPPLTAVSNKANAKPDKAEGTAEFECAWTQPIALR